MHWLEIDNFGSTITHTYKVSVSYEGLTLSRSYSISYKIADKNLEFKPVKYNDLKDYEYNLTYNGSNKICYLYWKMDYK